MMEKGSPKLNCTSSEAAIGLYRVVRRARYVLVLVLELEMRRFATATVVLTEVRLSQKERVHKALPEN